MALTRATIRSRARVYADVGSDFATDSELNAWLDDATRDLHDLLLSVYGAAAFASVSWANILKVGPDPADVYPGTLRRAWPIEQRAWDQEARTPSSLTLPADFGRLLRVSWAVGHAQMGPTAYGSTAHTYPYVPDNFAAPDSALQLTPMRALEITGDSLDLRERAWQGDEPAYRVRHGRTDPPVVTGAPGAAGYADGSPTYGWVIDLYPPVPEGAVYTLQLMYAPQASLLANDTDSYRYEQWAELVIYELAARCVEKQRSDSTALRLQVERSIQRIRDLAAPVDQANPVMPPYRPWALDGRWTDRGF